MEVKWEDIKPGDVVTLKWTGYARVPQYLSESTATVVKRNRAGNLVVQAHSEEKGFTRTIQPSDIYEKETRVSNSVQS